MRIEAETEAAKACRKRVFVNVLEDGRQTIIAQVARAEGAYKAWTTPWGVSIIADPETIRRTLRTAGKLACVYELLRQQALADTLYYNEYPLPMTLARDGGDAGYLTDEDYEEWPIEGWSDAVVENQIHSTDGGA